MPAFFKYYLLSFSAIFVFFAESGYGQFTPQKIKGGLFIENKGQWEGQVLYRSEIPSGHLYIEQDRFLFNFWDGSATKGFHSHAHHSENEHTQTDKQAQKPSAMKAHCYEVRFLGANTISGKQGLKPTSYSHNYFKGTDQNKWASDIKGYESVVLNDIYPNTSLVCLGQETGFKYEFHLQAGTEASLIQLQYKGVDTLYLKNGELFISTSLNTFHEEKPFAYQEVNGQKIEVECHFKLKNTVLSFVFPKGYNKNYPLIIDPQLIFSTYSGSTSDNWGNSATYDDDGNTYMIGIVFGTGYPVTTGAYQVQYNGSQDTLYFSNGAALYKIDPDIAIMKFDPTGALLYATYLGGTETEIPSSTIVNSKKELIVFGFTGSDGKRTLNGRNGIAFPTTTGAYDTTFNGGSFSYPFGVYDGIFFDRGSDLFVSILSEQGNSLIASTFVGGSLNDGISYTNQALSRNYGDQFRGEILCDSLENVYLVTKTFSPDIINATIPGFDKSFNGSLDGYICKLNAGLTSMIWDSYIGGTGDDAAYSIRIAADQSIYLAGGTTSSDLPATSSGIKTTNSGGDTDGFIMHLSADGSTLLNATYIGTTTYDQAFLIQLDNQGDVYTFGQTLGNYPMTSGVYGQPSTGQFIQKLDPTLSTSLMSTTFGSGTNTINLVPTAFLVNTCGNLMLSGWGGTVNTNFNNQYCNCNYSNYLGGDTYNMPLSTDAFQKTTDGSDFYIMVLNKNATGLLYSTYFGGNGEVDHVDGGTSRFDKKGIIYQSVCASCDFYSNTSVFPTTPNAYAKVKGAQNCNNAVFKLDLSNLRAGLIADTTKGCPPTPVTLTNTSLGGKTFFWDLGDGSTSNQFGPITHTYQKPGTYIVKLIATDLTTCIGTDTAKKAITVLNPPSLGSIHKDTTMCKGDTIALLSSCNPTYTYSWSPTNYIQSPGNCDTKFYPASESSYILTFTDSNSCVSKDTFNIHLASLQQGIVWENMTQCNGGKPTVRLSNPSTGPLNYFWTFGDGTSSSNEASPIHEYSKGGSFPVVVNIYNEYCSETVNDLITIEPVDIPNLFTPNADTHNDCFEIKGLYNYWHVEVYNRWSKCIFKSDNYQNDFCGDDLSSGVYFYLVCPPYGDCCKSWVQITNDTK